MKISDGQTLQILTVDDDLAYLKLLRRKFEDIQQWDVQLVPFTEWEDARRELAHRAIDVILLDYLIGKYTGLEIVKELRAAGDERPIIVLTGQGNEGLAAEISRAGADEYLQKDEISSESLRIALFSAMGRHQLRKEKSFLEEQLRQSQKMETIGAMAGGIAHDFNNMLTAIMGGLELAKIDADGREISNQLEQVHVVCRQMAELVKQLLNLSRKHSSESKPINLVEIFGQISILLKHAISSSIKISIDVPDEALNIVGNTAMMHQILLNLCINAAEAMGNGGALKIKLKKVGEGNSCSLSGESFYKEDTAVITVSDTGEGMPKEVLEKIFEPFYSTKTHTEKSGSGLGLAVVWKNIQSMGGDISVYSEEGRGTTFQIQFPAVLINGSQSNNSAGSKLKLPVGSESILVVDDEEQIRGFVSGLLIRLGYTVYTANDGLDALRVFKSTTPKIELVLTDMAMPRMNGQECFHELRKLDPGIKVIFSSGLDMSPELSSLKEMGVNGAVQKPYRVAELAETIRKLLDS